MKTRLLLGAVVLWVATGCMGPRSDGPLARMDDDLDRCAVARQTPPESSGHGATGVKGFRLASYSGKPDGGSAYESTASADPDLSFTLQDAVKGGDSKTTARDVSAEVQERPGPLPGLWETIERDVRDMPGDLWHDTKKVYTSAPALLILGAAYGGSLALQETDVDRTVEGRMRGDNVWSGGANDTFGVLGNPATHFGLAGLWYLAGQRTQNAKTYEVGKTLFSALIINGVSTLVGQAATWDEAPNGEWGTFPSGHTSSMFCLASVMHDAYGPLVGLPLYGLGTLVAIERLDDDEHYFSDVVMGAVLGMVIGHTVAGEHEFKLFGGTILPYADPNTGSSGVAWVTHFK